MKFKLFVKVGTVVAAIILVFVTMIMLSLFALEPSQPIIFTNVLLLVITLVLLLIVSAIISIHDVLVSQRRGRRR